MARVRRLDCGRRGCGRSAGFSERPRCLIRRWRALETWIEVDDSDERATPFDYVSLGSLLTRRVDPIDTKVIPLDTLNVIDKITFGGVLHLRTMSRKRGYLGPLFKALPGDLVISKIRVGQGSFSIIDSDVDHVAVSPEYPVYALDPARIAAAFLALSIRNEAFMQRLRGTGNTTKQRITPSFFEAQRIPLPPLDDQRAFVAAYDAALAEAAALEAAADVAEADGLAAFEAALGLSPPPPLPDRPIFIARFAALDRWTHDAALRRTVSGGDTASPHPIVRLGDVIADLENGWSPKCLARPAEGQEWGVLKLSAVSFGVFNPAENKALPSLLNHRPRLEVRSGDLLISRANVVRLVGATALVGETRSSLMLCDKIFRAVPLAGSRIDLAFVAQVLRLPSVRVQIESKLTGTSPTMKNISKPALLSLTFPLPPDLADQRRLIADLNAARASAAALRAQAAAARRAARTDFEAAIYG